MLFCTFQLILKLKKFIHYFHNFRLDKLFETEASLNEVDKVFHINNLRLYTNVITPWIVVIVSNASFSACVDKAKDGAMQYVVHNSNSYLQLKIRKIESYYAGLCIIIAIFGIWELRTCSCREVGRFLGIVCLLA